MSLFVFEGVDGVGKTTLIKSLASKLSAAGYDVLTLSDPSKELPLCSLIREEVLGKDYSSEDSMALFIASRIILDKYILDTDDSTVILLDRYWPSTAVYQLKGLDNGKHNELMNLMETSLVPDGIFLIEDNPSDIEFRLVNRSMERNRYDETDYAVIANRMRRYRDVLRVFKAYNPRTMVDIVQLAGAESHILSSICKKLSEKQ